MTIIEWILLYALNCLWWKWIISWGGAAWMEGWKAFFFIDWFAAHWNAEQIKLYALMIWLFTTVYFMAGLIISGLRETPFLLW